MYTQWVAGGSLQKYSQYDWHNSAARAVHYRLLLSHRKGIHFQSDRMADLNIQFIYLFIWYFHHLCKLLTTYFQANHWYSPSVYSQCSTAMLLLQYGDSCWHNKGGTFYIGPLDVHIINTGYWSQYTFSHHRIVNIDMYKQ